MCGVAACVEGATVEGCPGAGARPLSPGELLEGLRTRGPDRGDLVERRVAGGRSGQGARGGGAPHTSV